MTFVKHACLALFTLFLSFTALAADTTDNTTHKKLAGNFYAGVELGAGTSHCNNCVQTINVINDNYVITGSTIKRSFAANIFGGYQFNRFFAIEGGLGRLPQMAVKITATGFSSGTTIDTYTATVKHWYVAAKGILPLSGPFSLFAKGGADLIQATTYEGSYKSSYDYIYNNNAVGLYLAAGANVNFAKHWNIYLAYNNVNALSFKHDNLKFDYGTLGFSYLI